MLDTEAQKIELLLFEGNAAEEVIFELTDADNVERSLDSIVDAVNATEPSGLVDQVHGLLNS